MRRVAKIGAYIAATLAGFAVSAQAEANDGREVFETIRAPVTKDGVYQTKFVTIGGIKQWISVRGRHRTNPIILVIHGGPGFTISPVSYWYMRDWEEFFTVVQWDQRGAGKTYAANDPGAVRPTMSVDRLVDDGTDLIRYLTRTYGKDRVVLFAHSFGTLLAVKIAQEHPELLYAYVGTGQFTDAEKSERLGYEATLRDAEAAQNVEAIRDLRAMAPFPDAKRPERNLQSLPLERRWLAQFGGYYRAGGVGHNAEVASLSPDFTKDELTMRDTAQTFSYTALWPELGRINLMENTRFRVPVVILQGRHDRGTSSELVAEWFESVRAPSKKIVWFEDSGHMAYEEEPGKMLVTLKELVLPLTKAR